jgi:uncharacterized membrane protein
MRSILYIIAVILIIGWTIGTFAYAAGGLIHILLVIAVISLILGFLRRVDKTLENDSYRPI